MDEPTSALDNDTERHVMTALLDSASSWRTDSHRFGISTASMSWIVGESSNPVRGLLQAGGLYSRLYRQE